MSTIEVTSPFDGKVAGTVKFNTYEEVDLLDIFVLHGVKFSEFYLHVFYSFTLPVFTNPTILFKITVLFEIIPQSL